jgi:hypothetical protein
MEELPEQVGSAVPGHRPARVLTACDGGYRGLS